MALYVVGLRALRKGQWRRRLERSLGAVRGNAPAPGVDRLAAIEMLGQLTDRQREFVIARFWLGLSYGQIASNFGVSIGTATSTVTRALKKIRRDMDEEERTRMISR